MIDRTEMLESMIDIGLELQSLRAENAVLKQMIETLTNVIKSLTESQDK